VSTTFASGSPHPQFIPQGGVNVGDTLPGARGRPLTQRDFAILRKAVGMLPGDASGIVCADHRAAGVEIQYQADIQAILVSCFECKRTVTAIAVKE
jgi:hypothetical protein